MVKKVVIVKPGDVVELREKKVKATKATATTATATTKKPKKKKDVPAETKKKKRQDKSGTTIKTITIPVKKTATKKKKKDATTATATATQKRAKRVDRVDAILKGVSKSPSRKQVEEIRQLNASARVFNDVMEKAANTFSKAGVI